VVPGRDLDDRRLWPHRGWQVAGAALITWGWLSVVRVWLPSVVHIFGDAGSTPAAVMGLFALAWFLPACLVAALARRVPPRWLWRAGALVLVLGRVALQLTDGGAPQLYVASVTLVGASAALVALAAGTPSGHLARVGVVVGLGAETVIHAALGTVDLQWRSGVLPVLAVVALAAVTGVAAERTAQLPLWWPAPVDADGEVTSVWTRGSAWPWLALGPSLALTGILVSPPARLEIAIGWGPRAAVLALGLVAALAVVAAAFAPVVGAPVAGTLGAVLVVLCTVGAVRPVGAGSALAQLGLPIAIGLVMGSPGANPGDSGPRRRGWAAAGSLLLFLLLGFGYYAAYELPLPFVNDAFLIAAAIGLGSLALVAARDGRAVLPQRSVAVRGSALTAAGLTLVAVLGALLVRSSPPSATAAPAADVAGEVRVAAYNVHMGFDVDGRFSVEALADEIASTGADVVVLNEVDRGWLLEGGHDLLRLLGDATGMEPAFAPAADDVWGNAVLSRLPVSEVRTVPLPRGGAAMRRSMVSVLVDTGAGPLAVIGTHLHHVDDEPRVRAAQARSVAAEAARQDSRGLPVAVLGDLNAPADAPELEPLGFLEDAVPGEQPTYPSDAPSVRIDHVLVSPDLAPRDPRIGTSTASDHLSVAVTLELPADDG
jgi:endonuclease/exonuclease/phosphatase family metal-dependent hydrolase